MLLNNYFRLFVHLQQLSSKLGFFLIGDHLECGDSATGSLSTGECITFPRGIAAYRLIADYSKWRELTVIMHCLHSHQGYSWGKWCRQAAVTELKFIVSRDNLNLYMDLQT